MIDAELNYSTYTLFAALLEGSEPLFHTFFVPTTELRKNILINVGISLIATVNSYFIYDKEIQPILNDIVNAFSKTLEIIVEPINAQYNYIFNYHNDLSELPLIGTASSS
ncbi:hypothetical protein NOVO_00790 [Rickettsiales bacterium Ac37b]|nr:hypothetical protein NOVO_00790 [Rickettsiales bacterium Ac37b]